MRASACLPAAVTCWLVRTTMLLAILLLLSLMVPVAFLGNPPVVLGIGRSLGLLAATLLFLQFVLAARFMFLDRFIGFAALMKAHRLGGIAVTGLALLHPLFIYGSGMRQVGPLRWQLWPELLGALALLLLWIVAVTALYRVFLELSYESWRRLHDGAFLVAVLVVAHMMVLEPNLRHGWPLGLWLVLLAGYLATFVWVKLAKPARLRRNAYAVESLEMVALDTYNLTLRPLSGSGFVHLPGQFAFLRLRGEGIVPQQHPFTISSGATDPQRITFTVKAIGDYTRTLGNVQAGDVAELDGPYGHFGPAFMGKVQSLTLIAGGIGVTPMLSVLRNMAQRQDPLPVTLIWSNRTPRHIAFPAELEALQARLPNLKVHHVMTRDPDWPGPKGRLDRDLLVSLLGEGKDIDQVMLCGPPGMMKAVRDALRSLGVPRSHLHTEAFAL